MKRPRDKDAPLWQDGARPTSSEDLALPNAQGVQTGISHMASSPRPSRATFNQFIAGTRSRQAQSCPGVPKIKLAGLWVGRCRAVEQGFDPLAADSSRASLRCGLLPDADQPDHSAFLFRAEIDAALTCPTSYGMGNAPV